MVYVNQGIAEIQKVAIRGEVGNTPTHIIYAGSDNTYTGTETSLNSEIAYSTLSWSKKGINSQYISLLSSTEGNGSYIGSYGIATGSSTVSDNLHTINKSFIATKDNTFNVQLEGEIIMRRPNA